MSPTSPTSQTFQTSQTSHVPDFPPTSPVYLLLAILKKRLGLQADLYRILQVTSVTIFEKTPVLQAFQGLEPQPSFSDPAKQLNLFD